MSRAPDWQDPELRPRLLLPKPMRWELPDYLRFVRQHPCIIPKCYNRVDAHHVVFDGQGRIGSKVQDSQAVPMCRKHHTQYHAVGREQFEQFHGVNFYQSIVDLLTEYVMVLTDQGRKR